MEFGLGLVLTLTDNASSGLDNATKSMLVLSDVAGRLGSSLMNAGKNIISTLGGVISSVNETGMTLMYAENQLNALYASSGKTGKEVIGQIQKYAKESMFDFEQLIPAVTSLKSVGIEAFDAITSSTGEAKYSLLDYASGLASFAPQMKNAYGTGVNAAIGAMREYIAEGNAMSLKRGAGLDITAMLGEDKGATIEERTRQVADLIEQLGMMNMVDAMKDSPTVKLSNMGDVLFQLKGMISDSDIGGFSNSINNLIDIFYNFVSSIDDSRLETIAKNIGSALTTIMKPIEWLSKKIVVLAESIVNLVENNPAISKMIIVGGALIGVLLLLAGIVLKVTASLSSFAIVFSLSGKAFKTFSGLMRVGILRIKSVLLPFIALLSILRFVWKNDIAGIKTNISGFVSNLTTSFKTASSMVNGSVGDLMMTLRELNNKGDFFSNLTIGIAKVMMLFKALSDAWGDYTLSEENFVKAKELGILPLIEAVLDLKYRFENFRDGFIEGWDNIGQKVETVVTNLLSKLDGTFLGDLLNGLTNFFDMLTNNDAQAWYDFGESFAYFTALALGLFGAFKIVGGAIKILSPLFNIIVNVVKVAINIFKTLWNVVSIIFNVFKSFSPLAQGIILVITGIATAVSSFISMLKNGFSWIKEILMVVGIALATVGAIILGAPALIAGVIGAIVAAIATAVIVIKDHWTAIKDFFLAVWDGIKLAWEVTVDMLSSVLKSVINTVLNFFGGLINGVIGAINGAISLINAIPGVNISKIEPLDIPQLALGGVVTQPTQAIIGEAGTEAVVPLENNLGWLSKLANMISTEMRSITPTNSNHINPNNQGGTSSYMTTNNNNSQTVQGNTDNSVVFNKGAIQVTVQNATEEEAMRLARMIMEYIKRQKQLDAMLHYA